MKYLPNKVKKKLRNNQLTLGSWLNLPSLEVTEIMAKGGFEFLVIDMEHSAIELETAQKMAMVMEGHGVLPFARAESNDPVVIKKALEIGLYGVLVPMVDSKKDAQKAADAVYYMPEGKRGVGLSRAQGYGLDFNRHKDWYKKNISIVAQIEHINAIENLEEILSVKEIDATIIGPYDLSASLGYPGEFEREEVKQAIKKYEDICRKLNKPMGFHVVQPNVGKAKEYKKKRYSFIVVGLDILYLGQKCKEVIQGLTNG